MRLATIMNKIKEFFKRIKELSNKDKLFIKIMVWLLVLQILFCAFDLTIYFKNKNNVANAEYEDLTSDTLVNFNQLQTFTPRPSNIQGITVSVVDNWKIRFQGNYTVQYNAKWRLYQDYVLLNANHKYYFKINSNWYSNLYLVNGDGDNILYDIKGDFIYNPGYNFNIYVAFQLFENNYYDLTCGVNIIDLTQMFGAGNEPNLQQAQEYFTADYYNYNAGTPIPYSKDYLQGYNDGANAVYEALTITYSDYTIGANSISYGNNVIEKGQIIYDSNYGAFMFTGVIGIDLLQEISAGTNININFDFYIPDLQGESGEFYKNYKLTFAYIDNSNNLTNIATIEPVKSTDVYENLYTGTIILPLTTRYLYMYVDYARVGQNEAPTQIFSFNSSMSFRSLDVGLLMKNSYLKGQQAGEQKYAYGTDGYNNIYNLGFANGSNNSANGSIFTNGWTWVGMIFHEIGDILSIELLPGIPISLFVALPLLVGLLFFIVKITKGSGG